MNDKKLKRLLNEYADIPREAKDKDLSRRLPQGDVVTSPIPQGKARRHFWRYFAIGVSFAIVAMVSIPLALSLTQANANKSADKGIELNAGGSQYMDSDQTSASAPQTSEPKDSQPATSGNSVDVSPSTIPSNRYSAEDGELYTGYAQAYSYSSQEFYVLSQSNDKSSVYPMHAVESVEAFNDGYGAEVLVPAERQKEHTYAMFDGEEACGLYWSATIATDPLHTATMVVQLGAQPAITDEKSLFWRDLTVYYVLTDDSYRAEFVFKGNFYSIRGVWKPTVATIPDILDDIFGKT